MSQRINSTGLRWLWLVVVVLILDCSSKQWVISHFVLGQSEPLMPWCSLYYARNDGAAFSLLAGHNGWQRWFFVGVTIVIVLELLMLMYHSSAKKKLINIAHAFMIGGALGNLFDRIWYGFVVDFIDFSIGNWHYPTFNLADSFICIGVSMLLLCS
ncbi:signal peptidase II [Candidatus Gillettellia adelgis]